MRAEIFRLLAFGTMNEQESREKRGVVEFQPFRSFGVFRG
jgi:hypothetical protein